MSQWAEVRHLHLVEGVPKKEIARRLRLDDLSQLWLDIPPKTREELETRLQKEGTIVRVANDGSGIIIRERPPSIEKICNQDQNVFVHTRYICEEEPKGEGKLIKDDHINGVLRFLSYWIMEKMRCRMPWLTTPRWRLGTCPARIRSSRTRTPRRVVPCVTLRPRR